MSVDVLAAASRTSKSDLANGKASQELYNAMTNAITLDETVSRNYERVS